jgi:Cd2+/Zn2+-exporting ATPase
MAFDKTGTITRVEFVVTDFQHLCEDLEEFQNFPGKGIQGKNEVKNICIDNRKIAHRASGTGKKP